MNDSQACISYLDESKIDCGNVHYYTIASMTASKKTYIEEIETKWKALREKYSIPDGHDIHFTKLKHLLNRNPKRSSPHDPFWLSIFLGAGGIDYQKMFEFYKDALDVIATSEFIVQVTGCEWDQDHQCRKSLNNKYTFFPPYLTLREHLDLMALHLLGAQHNAFDTRKMRITKLRFYGDIDFRDRDDFKLAYHHTIIIGTRHVRPEFTLQLFDEIRFINKKEIAAGEITHCGSEIIDFMATILARDLWKQQQNRILLRFHGVGEIDPLPIMLPKVKDAQKIQDFYC